MQCIILMFVGHKDFGIIKTLPFHQYTIKQSTLFPLGHVVTVCQETTVFLNKVLCRSHHHMLFFFTLDANMLAGVIEQQTF